MTKYAIFSDVHANKQALELIFQDAERRGANQLICLGDMVAKYFHPKQVVDMVRSNCITVIKGNCDDKVAQNENYRFARTELGIERINYLNSLPKKEQLQIGSVVSRFYHSCPEDLEKIFNPLFDHNDQTSARDRTIPTKEYKRMFETDEPQVSIVGHTHMSYIAFDNGERLEVFSKDMLYGHQFDILDNQRAIINVGSAGEHNYLIKDDSDKYVARIDDFLTYALIDDAAVQNGIRVEIIKVNYLETLKRVYIDWMKTVASGTVGQHPVDRRKIEASLETMGVDPSKVLRHL